MKVKQLIENLSLLNPEDPVFVEGYEGGFSDIGKIELTQVKLNVNKEEYYGPHEKCEPMESGDCSAVIIYKSLNNS